MELTEKQKQGLDIAVARYEKRQKYTVISGYAGTGKSTLVKFIISAFEVRSFDEESKKKVLDIIRQMFSGVDVSVQYIRTYADNNVVKNKVLKV